MSGLTWIAAGDVCNYKYKSKKIEVLLYSSQSCYVCQNKLIPLFQDLNTWSGSDWEAAGMLKGRHRLVHFSALDTTDSVRPNIDEAFGVWMVPYIQMWAPSKFEYEPMALRRIDFENTTTKELKKRLVSWVVQKSNEIATK